MTQPPSPLTMLFSRHTRMALCSACVAADLRALGTNYFLPVYWVAIYGERRMAAQTKGVADAAASLKSDFLDAATRRRDEAAKSPLDERYNEAMQLLAVLAATVDQIEPSLLAAYAELWEGPVESEAHAELLREVGFSFWPSTAAEFVSRFISKLTG